jgi:hypothetical protein
MTRGPVKVFAGAAATTGEAPPDVEISASASADELTARERPRTRMRTVGPGARTEDFTRRENMPEGLEPGETHRGVRIERRVAGTLPEAERAR